MNTSITARERFYDALSAMAEEEAERDRQDELRRDREQHARNRGWPREARTTTNRG